MFFDYSGGGIETNESHFNYVMISIYVFSFAPLIKLWMWIRFKGKIKSTTLVQHVFV